MHTAQQLNRQTCSYGTIAVEQGYDLWFFWNFVQPTPLLAPSERIWTLPDLVRLWIYLLDLVVSPQRSLIWFCCTFRPLEKLCARWIVRQGSLCRRLRITCRSFNTASYQATISASWWIASLSGKAAGLWACGRSMKRLSHLRSGTARWRRARDRAGLVE